ncbi:MAG TPA: ATP-binding protein [Candidatus Deferrimicrobium sp.]|nr:ATP-binding protein [Candidatus Deferrimicrobium sp.]
MPEEDINANQNEVPDNNEATEVPQQEAETASSSVDTSSAEQIIQSTILSGVLGFVNFDGGVLDNTTSGAMVSAERRRLFRRDVYVGLRDVEQNIEFLGRIVQGPFHMPHEIGSDSAITRTTVLHPERTKFRPSYYVFGNIEVLGQLMNGERVVPTPTRPRPYSEIYIFPPDRLCRLLEIEGNVLIGHLMGYDEERIQVCANSENKNFLPRNVGIFGTIGSGKSNTVQVLVEEASQASWACVIIDVEGEYVRMNEANDRSDMNTILSGRFSIEPAGITDFSVYVPSSGASDAANPIRFKVPIAQLDISVISDILEFSEPQIRMFERVVEFARRINAQIPQPRLGALAGAQAQTQTQNYTLQNLIDSLADQNFVNPLTQIEKGTAHTLRNKLIYTLGRSGMLDWNANNTVPYLPINDLLSGGRLSVLDVSETDDRSRNIAIAYVLQSLFDKVLETPVGECMPNTVTRRPKVLLVIEEVHTFVSRQSVSKMRAVLDNLQTISRRGRKRWMSLALVSQQPGHVPDELFELANTRFIHQLKSATNLAPVKQTTGGVHEALWSTIPALGPGQCLLTGSTFKNPLFVNVRPSKSKRLLTN